MYRYMEKNKAKMLRKYISCECKYKFKGARLKIKIKKRIMTSVHGNLKKPIKHRVCKKYYDWNPNMCACECNIE